MKRVIIKRILTAIPVAVVTVIAAYGLAIAPSKASDHLAEDLQQEFKENQELIAQQEELREANATGENTNDDEKTDDNEVVECSSYAGVTFVGDSVMLGAAPAIMEEVPDSVIDAKESRQAVEGLGIVQDLEAQGKLGNTVVIALGINSYFASSTGQELIDYLGKDRKIYWVTVYGKYFPDQERINEVILQLAADNDNVEAIRWDSEAANHEEWFYNDGIHLNEDGRVGFAQLMKKSLQ